MFDIITFGSATNDLFVQPNLKGKNDSFNLHSGKKIEIEKFLSETGGGATNSAVGFSRLGLETGVIAKVGNDWAGHIIKANLQKEKVNTKNLLFDKSFGTALSLIFFKKKEDRTVFVYRGASQNIKINEINLKFFKTKYFYVSALSGKSLETLIYLLKYARSKNIKIVMNPGADEIEIPNLLKFVDILILNKQEAEKISGRKGINNILLSLHNLGPKIVAITDGFNPVNVFSEGFVYTATPYNVNVENTLGAGDAFCSGFVSAIVKKFPIEKAINFGLLNSSSVIQHFGAKNGLLYYKTLKKYEIQLKQKFVIDKKKI